MKNYDWILFDADETLFHFDAFSGLALLFAQFDIQFTRQDFDEYETVNKPLWVQYQNGSISAEQLQHQRFKLWANRIKVSAADLNSRYMTIMADVCVPLEGAEILLNSLKGKIRLGIITNGFIELQQARLHKTGLKDYFDLLIISEQVGFAKPHRGIFDHSISLMGNPERHQVLMVGDNPDSDILGGINAGLDTCWLNVHNKPVPEGITPHYQVSSLRELHTLLLSAMREICPA